MSEPVRDVRTEGRELALALLCHLESYQPQEYATATAVLLAAPPRGDEAGEDLIARLVTTPAVRSFAEDLVTLCGERREEIDRLIEGTSRSWRIDRMDRVDRNVIRLAVAELLGRPETPRAAILSEAVALAHRFGGDRSTGFVNGLVEALARQIREPVGS